MRLFLLVFFSCLFSSLQAQLTEKKLYNPYADASKDISEAAKKAKATNKHVLIQAGGNWCGWCIEFNRFTTLDLQIDSLLKADYVVYHLNYSPENKNLNLLAKYGFPQRFGFPVFLVLDGNGNRLHTQNSVYLEQGRTYSKQKVIEFLEQWNKRSIDPAAYKKF